MLINQIIPQKNILTFTLSYQSERSKKPLINIRKKSSDLAVQRDMEPTSYGCWDGNSVLFSLINKMYNQVKNLSLSSFQTTLLQLLQNKTSHLFCASPGSSNSKSLLLLIFSHQSTSPLFSLHGYEVDAQCYNERWAENWSLERQAWD